MDSEPGSSYSLDADDLRRVLSKTGGVEDEVDKALVIEPPVEKLATNNARLEDSTTKAIPESPWYLAILMVALVGGLAGLLFLLG